MTERARLLDSIAATVADYRAGEIAPPTPKHVDRWLRQFADDVQVPLLCELDHVLKKTYLKRDVVAGFLRNLVTNSKLAGAKPCEFWNRQLLGHSAERRLSASDAGDVWRNLER